MRALNRILLATDFSESAENAVQIATGIAMGRQAELHILTVHVTGLGQDLFAYDTRRALYQAQKDRLKNYEPGTDLKTVKVIESGDHAASVIVDYVQKHAIDLIAIGTHSRRGFARFFLGSVAAEVVRTAPIPVLVAGAGHAAMPYDHGCIVAPVNFSDQSLAALREAGAIAEMHDAWLVALYVVDTAALPLYYQSNTDRMTKEAHERLSNFIKTADIPVSVEPIVTMGSVHTEIVEFAKERGADLIVMGATGLVAVERFLLGSSTDRVLRMAPCPVLVHHGSETTPL